MWELTYTKSNWWKKIILNLADQVLANFHNGKEKRFYCNVMLTWKIEEIDTIEQDI